jgi:hypothetical protein
MGARTAVRYNNVEYIDYINTTIWYDRNLNKFLVGMI